MAATSGTERISDPRRIRAIAHPLRLQLIDLLAESELTATQCAERTGDSVASCSFHLRTLAKYGYVEPAERRGREKPWRLVSRSRDIRPDYDDPASMRAVEETAALYVEHEFAHIRSWLGSAIREAPEWLDATTISTSAFWATKDELAAVSRTIQELSDRFAGRNTDPSLRPDGSRPIRVFGVVSIDLAREARERGDSATERP